MSEARTRLARDQGAVKPTGTVVHRPSSWIWSVMLVTLGIFGGFAALTFQIGAPLWQRAASVLFAVLAVAALGELAVRRVELKPTGLLLVSGLRRRLVPREEIESVTWEKGAGVAIRLQDGQWVRMPDVGPGRQGLANSIRAWLKRTWPAATDPKKSMSSDQALQPGPAKSASPDTRAAITPFVPPRTAPSAAKPSIEQLQTFLLLLREPAQGAALEDQSKVKGKAFEQAVGTMLSSLELIAGGKVVVETQPRISLQNGEVVIPDFHLTVELAHERRHYLIECRDRERDSKDILHKIRHVRDKQRWQTFLFLYPKQISPELARALDAEGIMHLDLEGLRLFVLRLGGELFVVHRELPRLLRDMEVEVDLDRDKPQGSRLS